MASTTGGRSERSTSRARSVSTTTTQGVAEATRAQQLLYQADITRQMKMSDMGGDAYTRTLKNGHQVELAQRPGFSNLGKESKVNVNCYKVTKYPSQIVWQYEVQVGNGQEKRGLIKTAWESQRVTNALTPAWIFDGNKLAWSLKDQIPVVPIKLDSGAMEIPGERWTTVIDIDQDYGRQPRRDGKSNTVRIHLARTKKVDLFALQAYLERKSDFSTNVLECMTFIDHLMRIGPSKRLLAIKRSFFWNVEKQGFHLGLHIYAYKGVYQAVRIAQGGQAGQGHLIVNADVSNGCFFGPETSLLNLCCDAIGCDHRQLAEALNPRIMAGNVIDKGESPGMRQAKRILRLKFKVKYRNCPPHIAAKTFTVEKIIGQTPEFYMFEHANPQTGKKEKISMAMYFHNTYKHDFLYAGAVVLTRGGAAYAMENCYVIPGQRYPFKLDEVQTSNMIKFAVTRPDVRAKDINEGIQNLNWAGDKHLNHYGLQIDSKMIQTRARLLQPPQLEFGNKKVLNPGLNGQWRIDNQKFFEPNVKPLQHWGVMQLNQFGRMRTLPNPVIQNFVSTLISEYQKYGGIVSNRQPLIMDGTTQDLGSAVEALFSAVGKKCAAGEAPQLLIFIVNGKMKDQYDRLKKNCDCRFGIVSQVMQSQHVQRNQLQYIGNVLMKINAKLGGCTAKAIPASAKPGTNFTYFNGPTCVMGADVSHPGPGGLGASMAAVSISLDPAGVRYIANCETNGHRIEVIAPWNFPRMVKPLLQEWIIRFKGLVPKHFIYIRDGVSEGQYQQILQQELRDLKATWETIDRIDQSQVKNIKYTVIIASKRHHIRMFPADSNKDKNNNVCPGTLVERDVTTARDWDFYLCSHKAIQGTARPVHYAVIRDEAKVPADALIKLIYDQTYQYVRSTTSVSIHPAVYYAHLAARRAVAHERDPFGYGRGGAHMPSEEEERDRLEESKLVAEYTGKKLTESAIKRLQYLHEASHPPLIAMKPTLGIMKSMWFV